MTIVVGPGPEGADGPVPIEIETDLSVTPRDGLDLVYGDEVTRAGAGRRVVRVARDAYTDAIDLARRCAGQAVRRFEELGEDVRPDEIEMQLAIKVDAGVVALVKSGAEAQLQVTFRWRTDRTPAPPASPPEATS
ncbi:CU044_2847 family protein [Streptomyces longwoodensis]|uniref:CU044_2847 family protein n=1 Tax=Streptomyces longwoodensis TaxID=68231 RepID=UPI0036C4AB91